MLRGVGQEDAARAVLGGSRRAGVLARDATGLPPLFQKAGLVHDEDASGFIAEMGDDGVPEVVADAIGVPGGGVQEALYPVRPGLAPIASASCQPFLRSTRSSRPAR
jgi:hypothetical protein